MDCKGSAPAEDKGRKQGQAGEGELQSQCRSQPTLCGSRGGGPGMIGHWM